MAALKKKSTKKPPTKKTPAKKPANKKTAMKSTKSKISSQKKPSIKSAKPKKTIARNKREKEENNMLFEPQNKYVKQLMKKVDDMNLLKKLEDILLKIEKKIAKKM